jgi:hypothetical protein
MVTAAVDTPALAILDTCTECAWTLEDTDHGLDWFHADKCPVAKTLRDCYCTPIDLAAALGRFTLDVASNPRSAIQSDKYYGPEFEPDDPRCLGPNSLVHPWADEDLFCNGPFSDLLPFAEKLHEARSFVFLCNTSHETKWWKAVVACGGRYELKLARRQQFIAPPHIRSSGNNKPQSLLCDRRAYHRLAIALEDLGQWWIGGAL